MGTLPETRGLSPLPVLHQHENRYNHFTIRELLAPFEQTARLCKMEYLPPFVIQGTHQLRKPQQIAQHVADYRTALLALRDDRMDWDRLSQQKYLNLNLEHLIKLPEISSYGQ